MNIYNSLKKIKIYGVRFGKELCLQTIYRMSPINLGWLDKFNFSNLRESLIEEGGMQEIREP